MDLPCFRAVIRLLFYRGGASRGDCPRKALAAARGTASLPQERRLVAQIYSIQRTIPRNKFFVYGSKNFPISLPAPAGFISVRGRALLPRQVGAPHGVCTSNRLFKKITLPDNPILHITTKRAASSPRTAAPCGSALLRRKAEGLILPHSLGLALLPRGDADALSARRCIARRLPARAGFISVRGRALLPRQAGAPHG